MLLHTGRWPALVDANILKRIIGDLLRDEAAIEASFYQEGLLDAEPCQGDIVELRSAAPFIDEQGEPVVTEDEFQHWIILRQYLRHVPARRASLVDRTSSASEERSDS